MPTTTYLILDWLEKVLQLYIWILLIRVVLSWFQVNWYQQPFLTLERITEPAFAPFRRLIPPLGGVMDISPIVLFFLLQLVMSVIHNAKVATLTGG